MNVFGIEAMSQSHSPSIGIAASIAWFTLVLGCPAFAQERALIGSGLLEQLEQLKAAIPDDTGGFLAVGVTKQSSQSGRLRETALVWLDANGSIRRTRPIAPPNGARGSEPDALIRLPDGGMLIAGRAWMGPDLQYSDLQGWVAGISARGDIAWSRTFGGKEQDIFHFAEVVGPGRVLVGGRAQDPPRPGKSATEQNCRWSKGIVQLIDTTTGERAAPAQYFGDTTSRTAFLGSTIAGEEVVLAGFRATVSRDTPNHCPDDVLLKRLSLSGRQAGASVVIPLSERDDLAHAIKAVPGGLLAVGYMGRPSANRLVGFALPLRPDLSRRGEVRMVDRSVNESSRLEFLLPLAAPGVLLSGGRYRTSELKGWGSWLSLIAPDGTVHFADALPRPTSMRIAGAVLSTTGKLLLYGQAWKTDSSKWQEGFGWAHVQELPKQVVTSALPAPAGSGPSPAPLTQSGLEVPPPISRRTATRSVADLLVSHNVHQLGQIGQLQTSPVWGLARAGQPVRLAFIIARQVRLSIVVRSLTGDVDALLYSAGGQLLDYSSNRGRLAELIERDFMPGTYELRIATDSTEAQYELVLAGQHASRHPGATNVAQLDPETRQKLAHNLEVLGFRPAASPELGLSIGTERAIAAFQAGIGEAPTGMLNQAWVRRLTAGR